MLANYHTHTSRCGHARGTDREYVERAIEAGFDVLGFSDHCPWVFSDGYVSGIRMRDTDVDGYFSSLTDLKKEYADDIKLYIGFEAEYIPALIEAQDRLLADYPLDYMIMGQHFNDPESCSVYMGVPTSDEGILREYVDHIIEGMDSGRYRYLAHPDLLDFTGSAEAYEEHYTRLCQFLKDKDIPVEINMLGMMNNKHYPSERFFRIAKKVGNKAIIGCDAHIPEFLSDTSVMKVGKAFAEVMGLELVEKLEGLD